MTNEDHDNLAARAQTHRNGGRNGELLRNGYIGKRFAALHCIHECAQQKFLQCESPNYTMLPFLSLLLSRLPNIIAPSLVIYM